MKWNGRRRLAEMADTAHDIPVFNTGARPNIGQNVSHAGDNELCHSFGSFCQYLVVVTRCLTHDFPDVDDEFIADALVKEIAHGVSGCSIITTGCTHCHAMVMAKRLEARGIEKYAGLTRKTDKRTEWNGLLREDREALAIPCG